MKRLTVVVFFVAFFGWAWLEFASDQPAEGVKDILFWTGMAAVLFHGWESQRRVSR